MRNLKDLPRLRLPEIVRWAKSHYRREGKWPDLYSGPIPEAPGENWMAIQHALYAGTRGLRPGLSLPKLRERILSTAQAAARTDNQSSFRSSRPRKSPATSSTRRMEMDRRGAGLTNSRRSARSRARFGA